MEKTKTDGKGEHEAGQTSAREGEQPHEGSSPVSKPVNDAMREPKHENEISPRPDKGATPDKK